jgi:peptidoglycan/LPS O-acetylase OafA/YrhL
MSVEEQFYLLWPLALVTLKPRRAAILALVLIATAPAVRLLMYLLVPSSRVHIPVMLHTRVDMLMFGCMAALLWDEPKFKRLLQTLYRRHIPAIALCFLLIVSPYLSQVLRGCYGLSIGWTLEGACITLLLLWAIDHPSTGIGRLLNLRPVAFIGVMSYSLYLWQQLFLTSLNKTITGRFPLNLFFCFLAAFISYTVIERPFLRLRHRLASRARGAKQIDPIDRPAGPGI